MHRELTDAVISHLTTHTGKPIGDAMAPSGVVVDGAVSGPFGVVYPQPDSFIGGPMGDGQADRTHRIVVMCAGATREQAQWMADTVAEKMTTETIPNPTGRSISLVDVESIGQVDRDDTFEVEAFYAPTEWAIYTTPA